MSDNEFKLQKIKALLEAYIRVVELWGKGEIGENKHALWSAGDWLKKQLREALK